MASCLPLTVKRAIKSSHAYHLLQSKQLFLSGGGQDLWVAGEVFNGARGGYFLDIGAHDGVEHSNTYLLERRLGWRGICIEANPDSFRRLARYRRAICVNACLDSVADTVRFAKRGELGGIVSQDTDNRQPVGGDVVELKTTTLAQVLKDVNAPKRIDYLSVDVEGAEDRVLGRFSFDEYQFNCMTVERPSGKLRQLLKAKGYILVRDVPFLDGYFIHASFMPQYEANFLASYRRRLFAVGC